MGVVRGQSCGERNRKVGKDDKREEKKEKKQKLQNSDKKEEPAALAKPTDEAEIEKKVEEKARAI